MSKAGRGLAQRVSGTTWVRRLTPAMPPPLGNSFQPLLRAMADSTVTQPSKALSSGYIL